MSEKRAGGDELRYCSQCGTRLPAGARFCSGCGRELHAAPRALAPAASTWRDQLPGLAVLSLFLAVGLGIWIGVLRPGEQTSAAPRRSAPPTEGGGMPADHPPLSLPDEARQFIDQLTAKAEAAPTDVGTWKNLAQVQSRAAEIDPSFGAKALESYRHLASLAPDDPEIVRGLGNAYYDQQQYAAAAEQYERYLKAHPDDASVRTDLGTAYLYQRQVDRAVDTYGAVIKARPDFLQAHFNLGLAYEAGGEHEKALASLAKARELASDEPTRTRIDRVVAQLKGEASGTEGGQGRPGVALGAGEAGGGGDAVAATGAAPAGGAGAGAPGTAGGGKDAGTPGRGTAGGPLAVAPGAAGGPAAATGGGAAPAAGDFRGQVEASLRAHPILGPKITSIEWPDPARARVTVASFPMQSMPEFARNLFHARLETMLDDAKTKFGVTDARTIEIVDAASGTAMETVTH